MVVGILGLVAVPAVFLALRSLLRDTDHNDDSTSGGGFQNWHGGSGSAGS